MPTCQDPRLRGHSCRPGRDRGATSEPRDAPGHIEKLSVLFSVSDQNPDRIRIQSGQWIRIRIKEGKINHKNRKKVRKFHVMKCWMFFRGLKASPEAWTSFMEAKDKKLQLLIKIYKKKFQFSVFSLKCRIRFRTRSIRIRNTGFISVVASGQIGIISTDLDPQISI